MATDNIAQGMVASLQLPTGAQRVSTQVSINGSTGPSRTVAQVLSNTIYVRNLGAVGDGTLHTLSEFYSTLAAAQAVYPFATSLSQSVDWCAIQLACNIAYDNHTGLHPDIDLGFGMYVVDADIQCYAYMVIRGRSAGTSHSQTGYLTRGYQTTILCAPGYNGNIFTFNTNSQSGSTSLSDVTINRICFRGNWTGPGDATNTTGRAIYFNGVYMIQNCYIEECEFHNFAQDAVYCNVIPLPVRMSRLWGRYIGGSVVNLVYSAGRGSHSLVLEDIQGDFIGYNTLATDAAGNPLGIKAPLVFIDASLRVGVGGPAESLIVRDVKHEIDSSASSTTAYSPNTIVLNNCDRMSIAVENVNTIPGDPIGTAGMPVSNACVLLTGTTTPMLYWNNVRLGSTSASTDYSVQDVVNSVNFDKSQRSGVWMGASPMRMATPNTTDIILSGRIRAETSGTIEANDRFQIGADGATSWGAGGASAPDCILTRPSSHRMNMKATFEGRKLAARGGGSNPATQYSLSGWGTGATVALTTGMECTDGKGSITVTAGTGPTAQPTVVLTYFDTGFAPWPVNPIAVANMGTLSTGAIALISTNTPNTSTMTMRYEGTPVAGQTYVINYHVIG